MGEHRTLGNTAHLNIIKNSYVLGKSKFCILKWLSRFLDKSRQNGYLDFCSNQTILEIRGWVTRHVCFSSLCPCEFEPNISSH